MLEIDRICGILHVPDLNHCMNYVKKISDYNMTLATGLHCAGENEETIKQLKLADTFFNHSVSCLVILDREYNFIRVNEAYAKACKRDIGEFVGHNHFDLYPSDTKLIFDVTNIKLLPSAMLGLLASLRKKVNSLEILNPSHDALEALRILGFDKFMTIVNASSESASGRI